MRRILSTQHGPLQQWVNGMNSFSKRSGKHFSVLGHREKRPKGQGICHACSISVHTLGRLLDALGVHFASFFKPSFLTSIFHSFFVDFERVLEAFWEAKRLLKLRIWFFQGVCIMKPYFWLNFVEFLIKTMMKNICIFNEILAHRFINCFLNLLISSLFET